jgi:hypothetical protein
MRRESIVAQISNSMLNHVCGKCCHSRFSRSAFGCKLGKRREYRKNGGSCCFQKLKSSKAIKEVEIGRAHV